MSGMRCASGWQSDARSMTATLARIGREAAMRRTDKEG